MGKVINLAGQVFGRLTVERLGESSARRGGSVAQWWCRCECGGVVLVRSDSLRGGRTRSCGCLNRERISAALTVDMAGMRFGRWSVLRLGEPHIDPSGVPVTRWWCRCVCGTERLVRGVALRDGSSRSCGCARSSDLSGMVFGRWTVERSGEPRVSPNGRRDACWWCRCECGTEKLVLGSSLSSGSTKSCGCFRDEISRNRLLVDSGLTYSGIHSRLRIYRGVASGYSCVDCGKPAQEWSYRKRCAEESRVVTPRGFEVSYCPMHVECYSPRCKPCHASFDRS